MPRFENSSESSMVVSRLASSSDLQFPGMPLMWYGYGFRSALLSMYLRQLHTVLGFIMLEFRDLIAAWQSESMMTFRSETLPFAIILACFLYCHHNRLKYTAVVRWSYRLGYSNRFRKNFFLKSLHTYIIGHYNPSARIIDPISHTTYVQCDNFYKLNGYLNQSGKSAPPIGSNACKNV